MEFLIISGMSGAGKSQAADILEDMDYYCVDECAAERILCLRFAELCLASQGRYERVALVTDVREREKSWRVGARARRAVEDGACSTTYCLWRQSVPTIVRRYKSSRRPHPMQEPGDTVEDAVRREARSLAPAGSGRIPL